MRRTITSLLVLLVVSGTAGAAEISYSIIGIVSGTAGTSTFSNAAFSITGLGDDSGSFAVDPGVFANPLYSLTITISGVGSGILTDPSYEYTDQTVPGAGFIDEFTGDIVDIGAPQFSTYYNVSSLGPIGVTLLYSAPLSTTAGLVTLGSAKNLEFSVKSAASVPEPSSFVLALAGLLLLACKRMLVD